MNVAKVLVLRRWGVGVGGGGDGDGRAEFGVLRRSNCNEPH